MCHIGSGFSDYFRLQNSDGESPNVDLNDLLKIRTNLNSTLKKLNGTGNIINQIKRIEKLGGIVSKDIPELPAELAEEESEV